MIQRVKSSNGSDSQVPLTGGVPQLNGNEQFNGDSSPDTLPNPPSEQASYMNPQASQTTLPMQVMLSFFYVLYFVSFLRALLMVSIFSK